MSRLLYALVLLFITTTLPSCGRLQERIGPVENLRLERHGTAGADLEATITNQTGHNLHLKAATLRLYYREAEIARGELLRPVTIHRRSREQIESRWRLRSEDPAALNMLLGRIERGELDGVEAALCATVRFGWVKKSFSLERRPLSDFLRTFDPVNEDRHEVL